jgi:hypothetical protein
MLSIRESKSENSSSVDDEEVGGMDTLTRGVVGGVGITT